MQNPVARRPHYVPKLSPAKRFGQLGALFIAALLLAACTTGSPTLKAEVLNFDFGEVVNGEILSRNITISNAGTADLVIESISTSCGCTTATLTPMIIPAGTDAQLFIEFDSGAHGPEESGRITRQIFIASNDASVAEMTIEFSATIVSATGP